MSSERDFDALLRSWFEESVPSGQPQGLLEAVVTATGHMRSRPAWLVRVRGVPMPTGREGVHHSAPLALAAAALAIALLIATGLILRSPNVGPPPPSPDPTKSGASNGWIAYSTAPADYDHRTGQAEFLLGSDIYIVRAGEDPRLIADRDGGDTWNVCPVFSPGGKMLAFGEETAAGRAIVVLGLDVSGSITDPNVHLPVEGTGNAPCPRWSSDGTRVAYLEGGAVVVRGLDGSSPAIADGDPAPRDFVRYGRSLPSPSAELVARSDACTIVVARLDGSDPRELPTPGGCGLYALGTWSPDGREILYMQDVSGLHFTLFATSVETPYDTTTIVERVRVNHGRSWPGNGDVSWQPVFVPSAISEPTTAETIMPEPTARTAGIWTSKGSMNHPRQGHSATLLLDGRVLVAGGGDVTAELYDPANGSWTATGELHETREGHTATLLPDGKVLVAGGIGGQIVNGIGGTDALASAELYDPVSGSWTATGTMIDARRGHTATLLPSGTVLVAGGLAGVEGTSAELYDPVTGSWTATRGMLQAGRAFHTATLLLDGRVLVAGGTRLTGGPGDMSATAEVYDPNSGTWTATGSMTQGRVESTATLLPDGMVLLAGTEGGDPTSAELYDPLTGTWVATGSMVTARYGHRATLLPDGTVLVTGGVILSGPSVNGASTEVYDPISQTWTATADMEAIRSSHTATPLPNGTVLVAGGVRGSGDSPAVVQYDPGGGS